MNPIRLLPAVGQTLTEYSVIIGLVVVVLIVPMTMMGDWTRTLFQGMVRTGANPPPALVSASNGNQSLATTVGATRSPAEAPSEAPPEASSDTLQTVGTPVPRNYVVTLSNGQTLNVPLADPAAVVETVGGSGMTGNALAALDAVIRQLEDPRVQTDPDLIASLRRLSLRGHEIKNAQKLIESHLPPNGFKDKAAGIQFLRDTTVMYDGQMVSLKSLGDRMKTGVSSSVIPGISYQAQIINVSATDYLKGANPGSRINSSTNDLAFNFMNEYYQLHQSGLLNDPVLKRLVGDELTQQIFVSATSTSMNIDKSELKGLVQATRAGANGICTLSNYTDCQG